MSHQLSDFFAEVQFYFIRIFLTAPSAVIIRYSAYRSVWYLTFSWYMICITGSITSGLIATSN
jgi:hypothetical protein